MQSNYSYSNSNNLINHQPINKDTGFDEDKVANNKHSKKYNINVYSDKDSNITSASQKKDLRERQVNDFRGSYDVSMTSESVVSKWTSSDKSDESVLEAIRNDIKHVVRNPLQNCLIKSSPLRLFNRRGKPLTDRTGQSLANVFGDPLVVFDNEGRLISDCKGNQIFNCFGESAIHPNTDLHAFPIEEPGIPVTDFHKKHVLLLFDSKGHPMTDLNGRPLVNASGKRMFGIDTKDTINPNHYKGNRLKHMYGKTPLGNVVRYVQIFDADLVPLTDENGEPFNEEKIICNEDGMPMCDNIGRPLYFNYGARVLKPQKNEMPMDFSSENIPVESELNSPQSAVENQPVLRENKIDQTVSTGIGPCKDVKTLMENSNFTRSEKHFQNFEVFSTTRSIDDKYYNTSSVGCNNTIRKYQNESDEGDDKNLPRKTIFGSKTESKGVSEQLENESNHKNAKDAESNKTIIIFDASKKFKNKQSSSTKVCLRKGGININGLNKKYCFKKQPTSSIIMECIRNSLNLPTILKTTNQTPKYNNYGKPTQDLYGNPLHDKYGIPLTGAHGVKINEKARQALRVKLRNTPIPRSQNDTKTIGLISGTNDSFGEPYYDKYGRPLYDLFGRLMYDVYGRPLTDAFGRPLVDAIGQPLMDSKGNVLTSTLFTHSRVILTDIFGRPLYDKYGRSLFDTYGRPRFDIYTNAIYDNCGRPASNGNGTVIFDFLNRPIQPYPEKPLYKNAGTLLPRYIDKILEVPSMYRVFKFSHTRLNDLFGGPLFDDFGRPLYNKKGKPIYDKYGRPLYGKDGSPLCDCYGRPLSEEIRESPNDQTLSVVDSLKLLTLTKESSQWMEMRRSEIKGLRSSNQELNDDAVEMKVFKPSKHKSTHYIYALTRITSFSNGRHALEILEAPLSPSTAAEMHRLPIDNKPIIMKSKIRHRLVKRG